MEEAAVMPTWQRLLAALTQTSKIFPISSSVRVGFSPVVPQGTMPAVLPGRAPGGGDEYFCRLSRLDATGCAGEAAGQMRVCTEIALVGWMRACMHAASTLHVVLHVMLFSHPSLQCQSTSSLILS